MTASIIYPHYLRAQSPKDLAKAGVKTRVARLRVFSYIRNTMITRGYCPTGWHIAKALTLPVHEVFTHMRILSNASGLPFPIPEGRRFPFLPQGEAHAQDEPLDTYALITQNLGFATSEGLSRD